MAYRLGEVYLCDYLRRSDHPSTILAARNLLRSSFSLALFVAVHHSSRKWAMGMGGGLFLTLMDQAPISGPPKVSVSHATSTCFRTYFWRAVMTGMSIQGRVVRTEVWNNKTFPAG